MDISNVYSSLSGDAAEINTELEVIKSTQLLEKVVLSMDLLRDPEFNPAIVPDGPLHRWAGRVGHLFNFSAMELPPEMQRQLKLDTVTANLSKALSVRTVPQSLVLTVTATTEDPLKSAQLADTVVVTYAAEQLELKASALDDASDWLSDRVRSLYQELQEAETELSDFNLSSELISSEHLAAMNLRLKETRARIQDLKVDRQATADRAETVDQAGQRQEQLAALLASEQVLVSALEQQSKEQIELNRITREVTAQQELYEYFLRRLRETTSMSGMQSADSRILSHATLNLFPSSPRPALVLTVSVLLGLLAGAGFILWRERRTTTFRTAEDLEAATGCSVLGQIPMLAAKARKDVVGYLAEKPTSAAAEAVRNLRTSVLLTDPGHPPQIIGTTSSLSGEGKTTTALALAQNFTGLGQKVLLIEGDIRRRIFGEYLTVRDEGGLIAVMEGRIGLQEAVVQYDKVKADILTADTSSRNAADLFSSQDFERVLSEARGIYDTIIIDTAPVLLVSDSRIIAQHVDAMLFVVAWGKTSQEQVTAALNMFESVSVPIAGLVLNQIDPKGMKRYGHAGRYGAYASYGSKYYVN